MLFYDRNIIGPSSEIFGYLRQSLESVRKMFGNVRPAFRTILENLRKSSDSGRKSSENRHKRRYQYVYIINRIFNARSWILILSSCVQLEDKIHIHAQACNILYDLLLGIFI